MNTVLKRAWKNLFLRVKSKRPPHAKTFLAKPKLKRARPKQNKQTQKKKRSEKRVRGEKKKEEKKGLLTHLI